MRVEKCIFCQKDIIIKKEEPRGSLKGHYGKCEQKKLFIDNILTKEFIEKEYFILGKSALQISQENNNIPVGAVIYKVKNYGFASRTISESRVQPISVERGAQTSIQRTGFRHNFCKEHPSRIKWQEKLLLEEGITTVFQREDVKKKINISIFNNEESKQKTMSSIHKKVTEYLEIQGIDIKIEKCIKNKDHMLRFYDIHIIGTNKIIEINGDWWHANPVKYKKDDMLHFPGADISAEIIWERDQKKIDLALEYNYNVLVLWENNIKNDFILCEDVIQKYILGEINDSGSFYQIYKKDNESKQAL